jgi:hypothetical protein
MSVTIKSTTDNEAAVTAALGDLAVTKPVDDKKPAEKTPVTDPVSDAPVDTPTDEPEPAEPETDEDPEELEAKPDEDTKPPKKKGGFQKKIVKLEQEKEYWRQEALRSQSNTPQAKIETPKDLSLRPKATDFANHDDYVEALVDWKAEQKITAIQTKSRQDDAKAQIQTRFNTHSERVESFKETHEDFDEALENVSTVPMSIAVQESIIDSDHGPEMMYALANDPKEFKRICSLPPLQAAREMGRLESKFVKTATPSSDNKTTRAPKPVTPVRTRGASATKDLNDPNLSYEDFKRLRTEQIKQNSMRR